MGCQLNVALPGVLNGRCFMASPWPGLEGENGLAVRDAGEVVDMVKYFINDGHAIARLRHQAGCGHPSGFALGWDEWLALVVPFQPQALRVNDHQQADARQTVPTMAGVHDHVAGHLRQAQGHVMDPEFQITVCDF